VVVDNKCLFFFSPSARTYKPKTDIPLFILNLVSIIL
jgi:hypothetical protein